jgi:hypothetical protein
LATDKRRYLFENTLGAPYVSGTFSKFFTDVFKKKLGASLGVNSIRHLKITDFNRSNPSIAQKEQLAYEMGNSVEMQGLYNIATTPAQLAIKKGKIQSTLAEIKK